MHCIDNHDTFIQTLSAVCNFENVQQAVDTTVQVLQMGIPMGRIGERIYPFINCKTIFLFQQKTIQDCIFTNILFYMLLTISDKPQCVCPGEH